jgi:hypothetical protein
MKILLTSDLVNPGAKTHKAGGHIEVDEPTGNALIAAGHKLALIQDGPAKKNPEAYQDGCIPTAPAAESAPLKAGKA